MLWDLSELANTSVLHGSSGRHWTCRKVGVLKRRAASVDLVRADTAWARIISIRWMDKIVRQDRNGAAMSSSRQPTMPANIFQIVQIFVFLTTSTLRW